MTAQVSQALALWGLETAACSFEAGRENMVYRVTAVDGDYALRIRRPGYRHRDEVLSELTWLDAMHQAGLHVPRPIPSLRGQVSEPLGAAFVDLSSWLRGTPLGKSRTPLVLKNRVGTFHAIGAEMARLHLACDGWVRPDWFRRCNWDSDGLLGDAPVWGRFWENPTLDAATRHLFQRFRQTAQNHLAHGAHDLDHGLIHADLVRENLLLDGDVVRMIDFDDGGFGYRQFDMATVLLKTLDEPDYPQMKAALIHGYHSLRALDLSALEMFVVLRALTYVGWIVPRIHEEGGHARNARFIAQAAQLCAAYLQNAPAR